MVYQTERLVLQVLTPNYDMQVLHFYMQNKSFFEPWEADRDSNFYTLPYQKTVLAIEYNKIIKSQFLRFYIFEKDHPTKIIGTISFSNFLRGAFQTCTIGYKIHQNYCHKGYATEAISFAISIVLEDLKMHRIEALVHPNNLASKILLEKLGFLQEGVARKAALLNGTWEDHERYALV